MLDYLWNPDLQVRATHAFAVVGAAGLIRYRSRIDDPKDAGVMLVALTIGLAAGTGLFLFASIGCVFVIVVLWILESFEPNAKSRFDLKVTIKAAATLQPELESMLADRGVRKLTRLIRELGDRRGATVEWEIKKYEIVMP